MSRTERDPKLRRDGSVDCKDSVTNTIAPDRAADAPPASVRGLAGTLRHSGATAGSLAPGIAFAAAVAAMAVISAPAVARLATIPAMVLALIIGMLLNPLAMRSRFQPGLVFCIKQLLRWAVALLGLRIALADIASLGAGIAVMVVLSMAATILAGVAFARWLGLPSPYGALAGAATAVCGASAALATVTVLPDYRGKETDVVFVVIAVNALSTLAMVAYPPLAAVLGLDHHLTGILIGATIHDVAQVVGAGYAVSDTAGNTAVIVKLFRVFLLLPVVLALGWWYARAGRTATSARVPVPVPVFAFVFLALCVVNSILPSTGLAAFYADIKVWLVEASTAGLLIAIAALGLGTSLTAIRSIGWRHLAAVVGATLVILALVAATLRVMQ